MDKELAKRMVNEIATQLVNVQPMPPTIFKDVLEAAKSEQWLKENGYRPVEPGRPSLLWIKD